MLRIEFRFKDEFDQESELNKTYTEDVLDSTTPFDLLLDNFKAFLTASGFSDNLVKKIKYIETEDDE